MPENPVDDRVDDRDGECACMAIELPWAGMLTGRYTNQ